MPDYSLIQKHIARLTRSSSGSTTASDAGPDKFETTGAPAVRLAQKFTHLSEMDVFVSLPASEKAWLLHNTTMINYSKGHIFYRPNQVGEVIFILKTGRVDLFRLTADGRKLVIENVRPHTIFGQMGLVGQQMYGCFAQATTACLICVMSRSDMVALITRNPAVGLTLLADVGDRLKEREDELESLAFHALLPRLATLLLREMDASGTVKGMTHQDIADRLGSRRETISQLLGRFRDEGLVHIEPKRIGVLDHGKLTQYQTL